MSSKDGSRPDPDPAELVRSIEATRDSLAETVDAIADRVSPKRVAARTKEQVRTVVQGGVASVTAGADVVKQKLAGSPPPAPPARPLDGGSTQVLPSAAPVTVPSLDLRKGSVGAGGPEQAGEPPLVQPASVPELPVRPEVLGGAVAALLLLLLVRRRRAAKRKKTGLAALLDR